jgi:hypothetical protein|tara:strand:- start:284 stop:466 length:183 start_codon:yes stop_codon:yes gene_type:complete
MEKRRCKGGKLMAFNPEEYKSCTTEKEALEMILEKEWFDWQQDEALDWFKENRGWFKDED